MVYTTPLDQIKDAKEQQEKNFLCHNTGKLCLEALKRAWMSGAMCDGVVVSSDGVEFPVHVVLLASSSAYFENKFKDVFKKYPGLKQKTLEPKTPCSILTTYFVSKPSKPMPQKKNQISNCVSQCRNTHLSSLDVSQSTFQIEVPESNTNMSSALYQNKLKKDMPHPCLLTQIETVVNVLSPHPPNRILAEDVIKQNSLNKLLLENVSSLNSQNKAQTDFLSSNLQNKKVLVENCSSSNSEKQIPVEAVLNPNPQNKLPGKNMLSLNSKMNKQVKDLSNPHEKVIIDSKLTPSSRDNTLVTDVSITRTQNEIQAQEILSPNSQNKMLAEDESTSSSFNKIPVEKDKNPGTQNMLFQKGTVLSSLNKMQVEEKSIQSSQTTMLINNMSSLSSPNKMQAEERKNPGFQNIVLDDLPDPKGRLITALNSNTRQQHITHVLNKFQSIPQHTLLERKQLNSSPQNKKIEPDGLGISSKKKVHVPDVSSETLHLVLEWIYTRNPTLLNEGNVETTLKVAHQLQVKGLMDDCARLCVTTTNPTNCFKYQYLLESYGYYSSASVTRKYILVKFEEVSKVNPDFVNMTICQLCRLLSDDALNVRCESLVWEAAAKWMNHNVNHRARYNIALLKTVRIACLSESKLEQLWSDVLVQNKECQDIIRRHLGKLSKPFLGHIARIPYQVIITIGGWSNFSPSKTIEVYDVRADCWRRVKHSGPMNSRAYHGQVTVGEAVYLIGGFVNNNHTFTKKCCAFNFVTKTWKEIGPMYERRSYPCVVAANRYIYAMGGNNGRERLNTVERYDMRTNQWKKRASMNIPRSDAGAAYLNGKIYIAGGFDGLAYCASAEVYDIETDVWTFIPPLSEARGGLGCVAVDGQIYAFGGTIGTMWKTGLAERYNPEERTWTTLPPMPTPRSNYGVDVLEGRIYLCGGYYESGLNDFACFDPKEMNWTKLKSMSTRRSGVGSCVISGYHHYYLN